jgi:hypothetical protein
MAERELSSINEIILHCSDSAWGDAAVIDRWHKERGWLGIGYHFVILNGRRFANSKFDVGDDGLVEVGRPLHTVGAHCFGRNEHSVGVCLIGRHHFTAKQLLGALPEVIGVVRLVVGNVPVRPHSLYSAKTCPNFDVSLLGFV